MARRHAALFALVAVNACSASYEGPPAPTAPATSSPRPAPVGAGTPIAPGGPAEAAVAGANAFGLDLYGRLAHTPGNLAFSPASIAVALSMTFAGARGATATEMRSVLHAPEGDALHAGWASVLASWRGFDAGPVELHAVNRLFGEKSLRFHPAFVGLTAERYGAPLDPSDFAFAAEAERLRINGWIAEQTRERIADLLPEGAIDSGTRLVLANATYLDAKWQTPFAKERTELGGFFPGGDRTKEVLFMHGNVSARHGAAAGVELAELAYEGGRFATLFVLPTEKDGLAALEARLDAATLERWSASLAPGVFSVALPRFRVEPGAALELRDHLVALGMPLAFGAADFSGMTDTDLRIDEVYHKAFVAVDEVGTEAAAATAVVMTESAGIAGPRASFQADRPFLFFVRDTATGLVLFAGRVAEP